jgi:hypothetical protein
VRSLDPQNDVQTWQERHQTISAASNADEMATSTRLVITLLAGTVSRGKYTFTKTIGTIRAGS